MQTDLTVTALTRGHAEIVMTTFAMITPIRVPNHRGRAPVLTEIPH